VIDQCPASSRWQISDLGEAGDQRVGQAQMDVEGRLQASASWVHGVVLDAVVLGVGDQVRASGISSRKCSSYFREPKPRSRDPFGPGVVTRARSAAAR
jgi:hypothetical protein